MFLKNVNFNEFCAVGTQKKIILKNHLMEIFSEKSAKVDLSAIYDIRFSKKLKMTFLAKRSRKKKQLSRTDPLKIGY